MFETIQKPESPERGSGMSVPAEVRQYRSGEFTTARDALATEEPLEIRVRGRALSVTMRTPGHDGELAVGFLLSEGIISASKDVISTEHCGRNEHDNVINVLLAPDVAVDFARLTRHVFASSSCGLCGKATVEAVQGSVHQKISHNAFAITPATLLSLPTQMDRAQNVFHQTGGLHAAALFDSAGKLLVLREDVGRHNAVDKLCGHALTIGWLPLNEQMLLVSGRTSFEILQKALAAGVPIVAGVSAPSSLAVEFAQKSGQTLVGFLRADRFNVYAHAQRIA